MRVTQQPSLKAFTTFGVPCSAALMLTLETEEDLLSLPPFDRERDLVLGAGSNVLLVSDIPGTVFHNQLTGKEIVESHDEYAWVEAGAGENWHDLVRWTLDHGLSGLENLSLIPGLTGAAPIQNIGAYGVELAGVLETVTAWDLQTSNWKSFTLPQCELAYRDSRFRSGEPGRYLICSVRLRMDTHFVPKLDYSGLREELHRTGIEKPSAMDVSDAVVRIRRRSLPDPAVMGNAGSFFKNPVLKQDQASSLTEIYPELPAWPMAGDEVKLAAAWMIEHCGFKGHRAGNAGVSDKHSLVLVNHGSATGKQIFKLAREVQSQVHSTFGIWLEPEPRIIDFNGVSNE
jgi:UDP-N-acetylmuramate dehydrogenase